MRPHPADSVHQHVLTFRFLPLAGTRHAHSCLPSPTAAVHLPYRYEQLYVINPALCSQALLLQRPQIVHLALKYGAAFGLRDDTMYDGLQLFDRVSCCGAPVNVAAWPLMLCSCLLLAARQVESPALWPQLEQASGGAGAVWQPCGTGERAEGACRGACGSGWQVGHGVTGHVYTAANCAVGRGRRWSMRMMGHG